MNLTASNLWRADACPASAHLPRTGAIHADSTDGTSEHAALALEAPAGVQTEVALAYNVVTGEGRILPKQDHREYPALGDGWLCGTTDLLTATPELVTIGDHKTGFGFMVQPAASNLQLHFYARAATQALGVEAARVEVLHANGYVDAAPLDVMELDAIGSRLFGVVAKVRESERAKEPRVVEGEHCWRCPCFARCPAKTQLALTLATGIDARTLPVLELTPEAVAKGWVHLKRLKVLLGQVEGAYRGFASSQTVDLGGGKSLGVREKSRESIDGQVAYDALVSRFGNEDVAKAAVELKTSKTAIEAAIKAVAKRGTAAGELREVLEMIGAANGIKRTTTEGVEEF